MYGYEGGSTNPSYPSAHPQTGGWAAEQDRREAEIRAANQRAHEATLHSASQSNHWSSGSTSLGNNGSSSIFDPPGYSAPVQARYQSDSAGDTAYYPAVRGQPQGAPTFREDLEAVRKSVLAFLEFVRHPISSIRTSWREAANDRRRKREWTAHLAKVRAEDPAHADRLTRIWGP